MPPDGKYMLVASRPLHHKDAPPRLDPPNAAPPGDRSSPRKVTSQRPAARVVGRPCSLREKRELAMKTCSTPVPGRATLATAS